PQGSEEVILLVPKLLFGNVPFGNSVSGNRVSGQTFPNRSLGTRGGGSEEVMQNLQISRRAALKGLGTAIALPWLEAMMPTLSVAASTSKVAPKRMAFVYVPNGVHGPEFFPKAEGNLGEQLPSTLDPLKPYKDQLLVLS